MAPFAFHNDSCPRHCRACPDPQPIDVISFVSHCPTSEHLVQTYVQCWRPPFTTVVSQWWSATAHVGARRYFFRGLVPMSLYTKLTTPPPSRRSKPANGHDLKPALIAPVPLLLNALYRTLEWLNNHPPPQPPSHPPPARTHGDAPCGLTAPHTPPSQVLPPPTTLPPPSLTKSCTSFQSAPAPRHQRHKPKLKNTPASPLDPSALCR